MFFHSNFAAFESENIDSVKSLEAEYINILVCILWSLNNIVLHFFNLMSWTRLQWLSLQLLLPSFASSFYFNHCWSHHLHTGITWQHAVSAVLWISCFLLLAFSATTAWDTCKNLSPLWHGQTKNFRWVKNWVSLDQWSRWAEE